MNSTGLPGEMRNITHVDPNLPCPRDISVQPGADSGEEGKGNLGAGVFLKFYGEMRRGLRVPRHGCSVKSPFPGPRQLENHCNLGPIPSGSDGSRLRSWHWDF